MSRGSRWWFWGFVLLLVAAHFGLHVGLGLGEVAPDLLIPAVLLGARRLSGAGAAALGLTAGLLQDSLSLVAFGASAVALTGVAYLGARSRDLFVGDSLLFVGVYLFVGTWLHDALYAAIAGGPPVADLTGWLLVAAPLGALYAAAVGAAALLGYRMVAKDW